MNNEIEALGNLGAFGKREGFGLGQMVTMIFSGAEKLLILTSFRHVCPSSNPFVNPLFCVKKWRLTSNFFIDEVTKKGGKKHTGVFLLNDDAAVHGAP